MDDILFYENDNQYNVVDSEVDQDDSVEIYKNNLGEEIGEDDEQIYKPGLSVSDNFLANDHISSEAVSVDNIIPEGTVINNDYTIIVSGNEVSDNVVSYNVINKPLNEYTTQEGLTLLSCFMMFVFGFVLIVRKGVIPWN